MNVIVKLVKTDLSLLICFGAFLNKIECSDEYIDVDYTCDSYRLYFFGISHFKYQLKTQKLFEIKTHDMQRVEKNRTQQQNSFFNCGNPIKESYHMSTFI